MLKEKNSRIPVRIMLEGIGVIEGELVRFYAPRTVEAILKAMPLAGRIAFWNEKSYFEIPIKLGSEKPVKNVEKGTIAYWPLGNAICFFFGETQPYSPVNIMGQMTSNIDLFRKAKAGTIIKIELAK